MEVKLNNQERRVVGRLLMERKALLIETTEDTTQPDHARRAGLIELSVIESIVGKLCLRDVTSPGGANVLQRRRSNSALGRGEYECQQACTRARRQMMAGCRQRRQPCTRLAPLREAWTPLGLKSGAIWNRSSLYGRIPSDANTSLAHLARLSAQRAAFTAMPDAEYRPFGKKLM